MINKKQLIELEEIREEIYECAKMFKVSPISHRIGITAERLWKITHRKKNLTYFANRYLRKIYKEAGR